MNRALRLVPLAILVGAAAAAGARRRRGREHVHVYFRDGSEVALSPGAPETPQLFALARAALAL